MRGTLHAAFLGLAAGLCLLAYLFPYFYLPGVWWRAIPSTVVILSLGALVYGKGTLTFFGLRLSVRELLLSVLLFILGLLVFRYLVLPVVTGADLTTNINDNPLGYVHQFFQVLIDEMILRAACLTLVLRIIPYPKTVVIATAVLFSVGHHAVYRMNGVLIDWPAMVSLFSFGAIANLLFVRFGHIGYGVALHYAWNLYRFNSVYLLDGQPLSEGMTFNYVEGNLWVGVYHFGRRRRSCESYGIRRRVQIFIIGIGMCPTAGRRNLLSCSRECGARSCVAFCDLLGRTSGNRVG